MTTEMATRGAMTQEMATLMEQVIAVGDLAKLTAPQRLHYYAEVCRSVGLNPLTRPFEYITLPGRGDEPGRMILYGTKGCAEQLRQMRGVSIDDISAQVVDGVYVVTVKAHDKDGRQDSSTGAVAIVKENGEWKTAQSGKRFFAGDGTYRPLALEDRANAMMRAETKAKRRVTLSLCGLSLLDASEVEDVPGARPANVTADGEIIEAEKIEPAPSPGAPSVQEAVGMMQGLNHGPLTGAIIDQWFGVPTKATLEKLAQEHPAAYSERASRLVDAVEAAKK